MTTEDRTREPGMGKLLLMVATSWIASWLIGWTAGRAIREGDWTMLCACIAIMLVHMRALMGRARW